MSMEEYQLELFDSSPPFLDSLRALLCPEKVIEARRGNVETNALKRNKTPFVLENHQANDVYRGGITKYMCKVLYIFF